MWAKNVPNIFHKTSDIECIKQKIINQLEKHIEETNYINLLKVYDEKYTCFYI